MPIEPPEIPPATPGNPRPEVPPPMREPGEPPRPDELPGERPDELPVRGPEGPRTSPATDAGITDLPGSEPDLNPGQPSMPKGTM